MKTKLFILSVFVFASMLFITSSCEKEKCDCDDTGTVNTDTVNTNPVAKTLTLQSDPTTVKDLPFFTLPIENAGNYYATREWLTVYAWTISGDLNIGRTAIEFNIDTISEDAVIDSAFLSLYFDPNNPNLSGFTGHTGDNEFKIFRITEEWLEDSTFTWADQPTFDQTHFVIVPQSVNPTQHYENINVTALVQDMINDKVNSHGFLLKFISESPYRVIFLASSDNTNASLRPKLVIHYTE